MLFIRIGLFLSVLFVSYTSYSKDFYVSPEIGRGEVEIDSDHSFGNSRDVENDFGYGVTLGKEFDSHVIIEGSYYRSETDSIFSIADSYKLSQTRIFLGYAFDVSEHFRIIPKIGYTNWKLSANEGAFLNSGPEERRSFDGNKVFAQLGFEFPINDWLSINASYSNVSFDFGKAQSLNAGVKFSF